MVERTRRTVNPDLNATAGCQFQQVAVCADVRRDQNCAMTILESSRVNNKGVSSNRVVEKMKTSLKSVHRTMLRPSEIHILHL